MSNGSIIVCKDLLEIDFNRMFNKKLTFVFARYDVISAIRNKRSCQSIVLYLTLDDRPNAVRQSETCTDSTELMFQLADDLARLYKDESVEDWKMGRTSLAQEKKQIANQIDSEMKNIVRESSSNDPNNQLPICTETIIAYLSVGQHDENMITEIGTRYNAIVTDCLTFYDVAEFQLNMHTSNHDAHKFVIVEPNAQNLVAIGFEQFNAIKQIYRIQHSSGTNETLNDNRHEVFGNLTLKLIDHYHDLATSFEERNDSIKQKDMLTKAQDLTKLLNKTPTI